MFVLLLVCMICVYWLQIEAEELQRDMEWMKIQRPRKLLNPATSRIIDEPGRVQIAKNAIRSAAGIYKDKTLVEQFHTENTVIAIVIAYTKSEKDSAYEELLLNWYCFAKHYGMKPLMYVVPNEEKTYSQQVKDLNEIGIYGDFISYPNNLFFSLVDKRSPTARRPRHSKVGYDGHIPSFKSYGTFVKLVPMLEVLEEGFDVVFFDLDIAFVYDPIPTMMKSNSDFLFSLEMRTCFSPSVKEVAYAVNLTSYEPNTGIMKVKATPKAKEIYYKWTQAMVDNYIDADQKGLKLIDYGARLSFDCNEHLHPYSDSLLQKYLASMDNIAFRSMDMKDLPKYCFLNEYQFQNGKTAFHCAKNYHGSSADYYLAMEEQNFNVWNHQKKAYENTLSPTVVHANFCKSKADELSTLGLWLVSDNKVCKSYSYDDTSYGKTNWDQKLLESRNEINQLKSLLVNGSMFKDFKWKTKYMYFDGKFRIFPNDQTIRAMGLEGNVIHRPKFYNLLKLIPFGQPFPEMIPIVNTTIPKTYVDHQNRSVISRFLIEKSAGIYVDRSRMEQFRTHTMVLTVIISYDSNGKNSHIERQLLRNWHCFIEQYGYKPLMYLLPVRGKTFNEQVHELKSIHINGVFISYPIDLFWKTVSRRRENIPLLNKNIVQARYDGDLPTEEDFGGIVTLIPFIEVIESGYSVLHMKTDVVFVHDPIPHITNMRSDILISTNMHTCYSPSIPEISKQYNFLTIPVSISILRINRDTRTYKWYQRLIQTVIDNRAISIEKSIDFPMLGTQLSLQCNPQVLPYSSHILDIYNSSISNEHRSKIRPKSPTYCYLNEYLFQNGKMALNCARNRHGRESEYIMTMNESNFYAWNSIAQTSEKTMAPSTIFMSHASNIVEELKSLGLWLLPENSKQSQPTCNSYSYGNSVYGKTNWIEKIEKSKNEISNIQKLLYNGSIIKPSKWPELYMYYDGKFRLIPNDATIKAMGLGSQRIHNPSAYNLMKAVPIGTPFPDLSK